MKLDPDWLYREDIQAVFDVLTQNGYQAYCVGGSVRNEALGLPVHDIDIATDARPERVMELARSAGLKAVPTGIEHGTVTLISDKTPFEVTSFRKDIKTNGRHAEVVFTDQLHLDAMRRDFTMNALYMNAHGEVIDPVGGIADLNARIFRFIGQAEERIREDYLRILRYYRFKAIYGDPKAPRDHATEEAISRLKEGLNQLSAERVTTEIKKLLSAPDPHNSLEDMCKTGVLDYVLPQAMPRLIPPLMRAEHEMGEMPNWLTRLIVMRATPEKLRLSKKESKSYSAILKALSLPLHEAAYRYGKEAATASLLTKMAWEEPPLLPQNILDIELGANADFPLKAADLNGYEGKALGDRLRFLEQKWIDSKFALPPEKLLELD